MALSPQEHEPCINNLFGHFRTSILTAPVHSKWPPWREKPYLHLEHMIDRVTGQDIADIEINWFKFLLSLRSEDVRAGVVPKKQKQIVPLFLLLYADPGGEGESVLGHELRHAQKALHFHPDVNIPLRLNIAWTNGPRGVGKSLSLRDNHVHLPVQFRELFSPQQVYEILMAPLHPSISDVTNAHIIWLAENQIAIEQGQWNSGFVEQLEEKHRHIFKQTPNGYIFDYGEQDILIDWLKRNPQMEITEYDYAMYPWLAKALNK